MVSSDFARKVLKLIKSIPRGKVASYGQIAALAGKPHGSRGVAWILHSSSKVYNLPWHRVINSQGKISFIKGSKNFNSQRSLLKKEGIVFNENQRVDFKIYQWKKKSLAKKIKNSSSGKTKSTPKMFSQK